MKKLLIFLFALLPIYLFAVPSVNVTKISPSGNPISCGDVTYKVSILNPGPGTITLTSFTLDYDNRITLVPTIIFLSSFGGTVTASGATPGDPTHNRLTITGLTSSGSALTLPSGSSAVDVFTYNYHIPCLVLPIGSVVSTISLNENIRCTYSSTGASATISQLNTGNLDYANLFYTSTGSTISTRSNMGATTQRIIRLEGAGTSPLSVATHFIGYLSFYDHHLSCNMYKISKFKMEIINRFSLATVSTICNLTFTSPLSPGLIYRTPTPIDIDRSTQFLQITEEVSLETTPITATHCIDACPLGKISNDFDIYYGCDATTLCNHITTFNGSIMKGTNSPELTETETLYTNSCFLEPSFSVVPTLGFVTHHRTVTNTGTASMYNIRLRLQTVSVASTEVIRRGSLEMKAPDGITIIPASTIARYSGLIPGDLPTCVESFQHIDPLHTDDNDEPIASADWEIEILKPNETVVLTYTTFRCCPSDTNKFVGNFKDPEYIDMWRLLTVSDPDIDVENVNECGGRVAYNESVNKGPTIAHLSLPSIVGQTNLTGTSLCDTLHPVIYELPITQFCSTASTASNERLITSSAGGLVSGKLRIVVITQRGLNPSASVFHRISSLSSPSYFIEAISGSTSATYSSSTGGRYQSDFDLALLHASGLSATYSNLKEFIEHSFVSFPITPCCPGDATPLIWVQFYLIPTPATTPGTCVDCQIPLAQSIKKINLHCPGCVTPGIITDQCTVERITSGYLDTDDNGLPNEPGTFTPFTDVAGMISAGGYRYAATSFMRADQIQLKFEGYAQDGDDGDFGVTYATLMNEWTLHSSGYPSPAAFTDLNIEIVNPCAASSQFNWTPAPPVFPATSTEWLTIVRTIGGITTTSAPIDISPYRVSAGRSYFYRVPATVTGAFLISISTIERYKISILFNTCGNGDAQDCEVTTRMWWSGVSTHSSTSFDTRPHAGYINSLTTYPPSPPTSFSEPDYRATFLLPDIVYYCEAYGSMISGFHLKETYSSRWDDAANDDFPSSISCNKVLHNTYSIKASGIDPAINNVFPYEYRPILPTSLSDHFVVPTTMLTPGYTYAPIGSSSGSTFKYWPSTSGFCTTSPSITPSSLSSPSATYSITGPYRMPSQLHPPTTTSIPEYYLSDEQTNLSINYNFVPTLCSLPGSRIDVDNTSHHIESTDPCGSSSINTFDPGYSTLFLTTPNPSVQMYIIDDPVQVYSSNSTCFHVLVTNNTSGNGLAENIVIHIPAPSAGGVISSVSIATTSGGAPIVSSGVTLSVDPIGLDGSRNCTINHLNRTSPHAGDYIELLICFDVHTCDPLDPLDISYTFGCTPSATSCLTATHRPVTLIPAEVHLYGEYTTSMPITANPCSDVELHSQYYLTALGEVEHLKLTLVLPETAPLSTWSVTASAPGLGCGSYTLSPIFTVAGPISGLMTYTITLDPAFILTLLPCAKDVLFNFIFKFGSCTSGPIHPIINMEAQKYCDHYGTDLIHLDPPLVGTVNISTSSSACIPTVISYTKTSASCLGHSDGSIIASVTGTGPFTFSWVWNTLPTPTPLGSPSSSLPPLTDLTAGSYTLKVVDAYHCVTTQDIIVDASTNPIHLPTLNSYPYTTCDQSPTISNISLTTYSTTSGYSYSWTATNTSPSSGTIGVVTGTFLIGLSFVDPTLPSTIVVRATDPGGCYDELVIVIPACCVWGNGPLPFDLISNQDLSAYPTTHPGAFTAIQNFRVNGLVTVNSSLILDHCTFYMEPNSEIVLTGTSTLTLNSCTFVACKDAMWEGFRLNANTHLVGQRSSGSTDDTRIYDALAGITSWGGSDYDLINVQMNRNWIDIDVKYYPSFNHPSSMTNCHLYCHTDGIPAGSIPPPLDGTLFTPHINELTFKGVNVEDNKLLTIGTPTILGNLFEDMKFGVFSLRSGINVYNNTFNNIQQHIITPAPLVAEFGDAIHFEAATIPALTPAYPEQFDISINHFTNVQHACILVTNKGIRGTINANTMQGKYGILGDDIGLRSTTTCSYPLTIWNNAIQFSEGGIQLDRAYRVDLDISHNNTITGVTAIDATNAYPCIKVAAISLSSADAPRISIKDNSVFNGRLGIGLINVAPPSVMTGCLPPVPNTISGNRVESLDGQPNYVGIGLTTTSNAEITCNTIQGTSGDEVPPASLLQKTGIQLKSNATMNKITCNQLNFLCRGLQFIGPCNMPDRLAANKFRSLGTHIVGSIPASAIGNQTNTLGFFEANEFDDIRPRSSINNAGVPPFVYYRKTSAIFNPELRGSFSGVSFVTVLASVTNFPCTGCTPPTAMRASGGSSSSSMSEAEELAWSLTETSFNATFTSDELGMQKISEEGLFDVLKTDSTLLINDSLAFIFNGLKETNTGQADEIKDLINQQENDEAASKLAVLDYSSDAEEATKQVLEVVNTLDQREDKLLTEDEMNTLQTIAAYCPYRYGQAVYSARVLINTQYGHESEYWDDELLCIYGITYRRAHLEELRDSSKVADYIRFYPNPATNTLIYELGDQLDCKINNAFLILLRDMQGNLVVSKSIASNKKKGTIDLTKLSNGQYIVSVYCGKEVLYLQKIVKEN